jgi:extracellular elastinolytic metalloproteinase
VLFTGPDPDTGKCNALDADTVFHEYTHAVTQRVIGGSRNVDVLREPQSAGLAEGWSDYFALTLQAVRTGAEKVTIGEWTSGKPGGARSRPYDDAFRTQVRFGSLGTPGWSEPHAVGEVWAATLLKAQRELVAAFPGEREWSYALLWQVVFDSLVLLPANPTFLEARDAMLGALGAMNGGDLTQARFDAARDALWRAFAGFGLGTDARCRGPALAGITEGAKLP